MALFPSDKVAAKEQESNTSASRTVNEANDSGSLSTRSNTESAAAADTPAVNEVTNSSTSTPTSGTESAPVPFLTQGSSIPTYLSLEPNPFESSFAVGYSPSQLNQLSRFGSDFAITSALRGNAPSATTAHHSGYESGRSRLESSLQSEPTKQSSKFRLKITVIEKPGNEEEEEVHILPSDILTNHEVLNRQLAAFRIQQDEAALGIVGMRRNYITPSPPPDTPPCYLTANSNTTRGRVTSSTRSSTTSTDTGSITGNATSIVTSITSTATTPAPAPPSAAGLRAGLVLLNPLQMSSHQRLATSYAALRTQWDNLGATLTSTHGPDLFPALIHEAAEFNEHGRAEGYEWEGTEDIENAEISDGGGSGMRGGSGQA